MRRRLALCASVLPLVLLGCAAVPGGELEGFETDVPEHWSFDDPDQPCHLETHTDRARSVRVGCYAVDGVLHIHSTRFADSWRLFGEGWVARVRRDPEVRVQIDDRVYRVRAEEVTDAARRAEILALRGFAPAPAGIRLFRFSEGESGEAP